MIQTNNDVHGQFAGFFRDKALYPFAYLVSRRLAEGHICLDLDELGSEIDPSVLRDLPMVAEPGSKQPFILQHNRLYLERYHRYETKILNRLSAFLKSEQIVAQARIAVIQQHAELIRKLFPPETDNAALPPEEKLNWQLAAAVCGALNDFTIITGGPGTGKTTTVARLLAVLYTLEPELKVALAAPTGKAALRMAESLKNAKLDTSPEIAAKFDSQEPMTVHRLLRYVPDSPYFKHNAANPLPYGLVIVDEASMLDAALFSKLLDAVAEGARLILLGDKDQLASVEAGSLLGDLCRLPGVVNNFDQSRAGLVSNFTAGFQVDAGPLPALAGHVVELKRSRRFSSLAGIGLFSKAVLQNDRPVLENIIREDGNEQVVLDSDYAEDLFQSFIKGFETYITESDPYTALKKFNDIRILCAVRNGEQGVDRVNRRVEDFLRKKGLLNGNGETYLNRPVMVTGNNYELGLFNGDVGIMRPDAAGVLKVWFEDGQGGVRDLMPAYIPYLATVFAMTIHKSQGSEYDQVLILFPKAADERILTREILYTAVTRARQKAIIQVSPEQLLTMAATGVHRASGIKERINEI
jgi:exodeoxyribonuclease V alpha subunit